MPAPYAIVACTDRAHLPCACVAVTTALSHAGASVRGYVVAEKCKPDDLRAAKALCEAHGGGVEIIGFNAHENVGRDMADKHVSAASYLRLHLDDLLPPELLRVLYLDSDTMTVSDIRELFTMNMQGQPLAAANDIAIEIIGDSYLPHLFRAGRDGYFNSGVLLFDWQAIRQQQLLLKTRAFAATRPKIEYLDQDCLNYVFGTRWLALPPRFNCMTDGFCLGVVPAIAHFAGNIKPWLPNYHVRLLQFRRIYQHFLNGTPFADFIKPKSFWGWCKALLQPLWWRRHRKYSLRWKRLAQMPSHAPNELAARTVPTESRA